MYGCSTKNSCIQPFAVAGREPQRRIKQRFRAQTQYQPATQGQTEHKLCLKLNHHALKVHGGLVIITARKANHLAILIIFHTFAPCFQRFFYVPLTLSLKV